MSDFHKIVFFDGFCVLCDGIVSFLIKRDKKNILKFTSLQSEYSKNNLDENLIKNVDTIVFRLGEETFVKSRAVIEILNQIGGFWAVFKMLKIFPEKLLNLFYDLIARYRYRIFGKRDACRIPTQEELKRFIA